MTTTKMAHNATALIQAGQRTSNLADAGRYTSELDSARVPSDAWGLLGQVYFHGEYDKLVGELSKHITDMSTGLQNHGQTIVATGQSVQDSERLITEQFNKVHQKLSSSSAPPRVGSGDAASTTDGSGAFVSDKTMLASVPGAGPGITSGQKFLKDIDGGSGAEIASDVTGVISSAANVTGEAVSFASDPLGWLISKGLGFLINILKPLKDALQMVTGDGPAVTKAAGNFNNLGKDLEDLAKQFEDVVSNGFAESQGEATDAARTKLSGFRDGIAGTAGNSGDISQLLQLSGMVMQAAEDFIKGIITDVVEFIVVSQAAALASSWFTFGASEGVALAADAAKVAEEMMKAEKKISEVTGILNKIVAVWKKIVRKLLANKELTGAAKDGKVYSQLSKLQSGGKHAKDSFGTGLAKTVGDSVKDRGAAALGVTSRKPQNNVDSVRNAAGITKKAMDANVVDDRGDRGEDRSDSDIDEDFGSQ